MSNLFKAVIILAIFYWFYWAVMQFYEAVYTPAPAPRVLSGSDPQDKAFILKGRKT